MVLVFACVMLHAGSCSADQLKMLPQPAVLDMPNNRPVLLYLLYSHRFQIQVL